MIDVSALAPRVTGWAAHLVTVLAPFLILSSNRRLGYQWRNWQAAHFGPTPFAECNGSAGAFAYTGPTLNTPLSGWECRSRQLSAEESVDVAI